jgi:glycine cleavage system aminomethyltransferase T
MLREQDACPTGASWFSAGVNMLLEKNATGAEAEIKSLPRTAYAPFDYDVDLYFYSRTTLEYGSVVPLEYSGWRNEVMSWKQGCYLHTGLNPAFTHRVKGPDALKLFSDICVNGFSKFAVGTLRHGIMCNEDGLIMAHGVLARVAENEFITHYLGPWTEYKLRTGNYNATSEFINDEFIFQVAGPRSLEVLEAATGECLHDIRFASHRMSVINGMDVRVLRVGMAGTLGYEVHGKIKDVAAVYNALMKAGEPFGITKLGRTAYTMSHTENGFPQLFVHFPAPLHEDKGFMAFQGDQWKGRPGPILSGSMGTDMRLRYRNPVELGWGPTIRFDHDFIGRAALEKEAANPRRQIVTLEWNTEDVTDVYASQFRPGVHYLPMEPNHSSQHHGRHQMYADQVLKNGKRVGVSSGRMHSYYYRQMISMCSIDTEHSALGTEVTVLWGDSGTRQKEIRATVSRFPYLNENRNEKLDVSTISCKFKK